MRTLLVLLAAVLLSSAAEAQVRVNLNFNVDRQPVWGPAGYDYVEFYYLPDIEVYYNVPQRRYYYQQDRRWISGSVLPPRYRGYDLYNSYKVVVNERRPYRNHRAYRSRYESFKGRRDQQPIRDSRDEKYFVNPGHPEHSQWVKQRGQGKGNGRGNGKGRGNGRGNGSAR